MTFVHKTISSTLLAIVLSTVWSVAGPAQAQQPGDRIFPHGGAGGAAVARPSGGGVGQPAIGAGVGRTGITGGHNFNAGIVRPPNLNAGIASPNIPRIVQPQGINRFGGLRNHGVAGGLPHPGLTGGLYNNSNNTGYNNGFTGNYRRFHGRHYGHYRLAPFDYPNIVPEYSYDYGAAPYSDYQDTCRVRRVKVRVGTHHHYHVRWVRRRICW